MEARLGSIRYLTRREVAAALGVSQSTVDRLIKRGALPVVRLGRLVRIPERALEDLGKGAFYEGPKR